MLIKKVRNLTEEDMWIYGTSGALVKLPSKPFAFAEIRPNGCLFGPEQDMYYISDGKILQKLEKDWRYQTCIAYPRYSGNGREDEKIYTLSDRFGNKLELVTDGVIPSQIWLVDAMAKKARGETYLKFNRFPSGANVSRTES